MLSFTRRRVVSLRAGDLNEIVDKAQQLIRPAMRPEIAVRFSPADEAVPVVVDEVALEHAVINLLTNARDAIAGPGTIDIEVRITQLDDDFVMRHEGKLVGRCARVSSRDTGAGIPEASRAQVFEPFFTTKSVGRGTGLGLAMVRSLVDQHGGVVSFETELGRGTNFEIYLPLRLGVSELLPNAAPARAGAGETILVAEDDDVVRALLTRVLRGQGYRVLEAGDGQTAIELFRAQSAQVRLVLTDLMMPRKSGLELVSAVLAFRQQTSIVVMSGYTSDPAGASHLAELGIPVISKPTTPTAVLLKIREVLDGSEARARAMQA